MPDFERTELLYENALASEADVEGFRMEGDASVTFPEGRMRMENLRDPGEGQAANFVYWCPEVFPDHISVSWDFYPLREPGLCILFFAAAGQGGRDLFDPSLKVREGRYGQYHSSDINALHISYFRRKHPHERAFQTCNLRKSAGFHMVARRPDPLPSVEDADPPYRIELIKSGPHVRFSIRDLMILEWEDDGKTYGDVLTGGRIGFRQMAPLIGEYASLQVHRVCPL